MGATEYIRRAEAIIDKVCRTQADPIQKAASFMAGSIANGRWVYLFGSGHSIIPVLDIFPRYGSFIGFYPLLDPRLMWWAVVGPGGAPELLWLERQEGYVANFLRSYCIQKEDTFLVYSHGGLNAAPVEAALYAKERGCRVVAVTSMQNYGAGKATHSSRKKLADVADLAIDNCVPPEDALVEIENGPKVAAGSTLAVVLITMALVAETAEQLCRRGIELSTFVSPNVGGITLDHNLQVFERFQKRVRET